MLYAILEFDYGDTRKLTKDEAYFYFKLLSKEGIYASLRDEIIEILSREVYDILPLKRPTRSNPAATAKNKAASIAAIQLQHQIARNALERGEDKIAEGKEVMTRPGYRISESKQKRVRVSNASTTSNEAKKQQRVCNN